jgi:hypothetical protein
MNWGKRRQAPVMRSEQIKRATNEKHNCSDLSAAKAAPEFSRGLMVFE